MQKKTKITIAVVAVLLVLVVVARFLFFSCAWSFCTATLHYEGYHEGKKINVTAVLEKEDWNEISRIFNYNRYEINMYRCPVNEKFSISAGGITYYIAGDGCDLVHVPSRNLCFEMKDRTTVDRILAKYGVEGYSF